MSPTGVVTGVEAATSSHIEEMIKELVWPEGLEVSATGMTSEGRKTLVPEQPTKGPTVFGSSPW